MPVCKRHPVIALVIAVYVLVILACSPAGQTSTADQPPATAQPTATIVAHPTTTPMPGAVTVRVGPDGSGDYSSLESAVDAVPPGSTIHLDAGTYNLTKSLDIKKPLRLVGAGMDQTSVVGKAEGHVVQFTGPGVFAAEGIAFRYEGTTWADVVVIKNGEADLVRCRFTGGIWNEAEDVGGAGLWLRGNMTGYIRECRVDENDAGVMLHDRAQPMLEENTCRDNRHSGIVYWNRTGGVARQNRCLDNGLHGISVQGQAQPTLEGNSCQDNNGGGIAYFDSAGGTARQNECAGNKAGIGVLGQAQPVLEENTCEDNWDAGIIYHDSTGGMVRRNECVGNRWDGILVRGQAQPTLEWNVCENNGQCGIAYVESAGGVALRNECAGNELYGIGVGGQAQPILEGNVCKNNKDAGIFYFDNAGGVARQNECTGNQCGIYVNAATNPKLENNNCYGNEADIIDRRL